MKKTTDWQLTLARVFEASLMEGGSESLKFFTRKSVTKEIFAAVQRLRGHPAIQIDG